MPEDAATLETATTASTSSMDRAELVLSLIHIYFLADNDKACQPNAGRCAIFFNYVTIIAQQLFLYTSSVYASAVIEVAGLEKQAADILYGRLFFALLLAALLLLFCFWSLLGAIMVSCFCLSQNAFFQGFDIF